MPVHNIQRHETDGLNVDIATETYVAVNMLQAYSTHLSTKSEAKGSTVHVPESFPWRIGVFLDLKDNFFF